MGFPDKSTVRVHFICHSLEFGHSILIPFSIHEPEIFGGGAVSNLRNIEELKQILNLRSEKGYFIR